MFHNDDESFAEMFKRYAKQVIGLLMFIGIITIFSNFGSIQRWIETFFNNL